MRKIISTFLIGAILFGSIAFVGAEENCKYTSQIEQCREANKTGSPKAIEDFLCVSDLNMERMVYNLIMDDKFKETDKNLKEYLEKLEEDKSRFSGPDQREPYPKGVDEVYEECGNKPKEAYNKALSETRKETIACLGGKTQTNDIKLYYSEGASKQLVAAKLSAYKATSINTIAKNKAQVQKDQRKKIQQVKRTKYSEVLDLLLDIMKYLQRIASKWPSKTKNPY